MNWLQFEYNLIPTKIFAEDKEEYIKALVETRETEDLKVFRGFMNGVMLSQLTKDISAFVQSVDGTSVIQPSEKTSDQIVALLKENPQHTIRSLAEAIGISDKGIEKQLSKLRHAGVIKRVGPARGGRWEVLPGAMLQAKRKTLQKKR